MLGARLLRRLTLLLAVAGSGTACAQPVAESDMKAQIVFRVLLFVQWPRERLPAGQPLDLCLFDEDATGTALSRLAGQQVQGHRLRVRKAAPDQSGGCHIAYVGARTPAAVPVAHHPGVLFVGDRLGLVEQGVMLNLQVDSGRITFDIGLAAARRAGLEISAKLLRLARFVKDD
ncbi:YfiR family protein [Aquabacterium sp. A7-Y]|uniref:YfiR family protein n=1 Tax=Aquabacterium sp. A7-Y TaxID=1349605 RepID=UPI00223E6726|nr:YfiR family protein [Aquabacterium sp. A7-Y]MCW7536639.1 YfiR family protein [Aquabacterium sp. A7-Y]